MPHAPRSHKQGRMTHHLRIITTACHGASCTSPSQPSHASQPIANRACAVQTRPTAAHDRRLRPPPAAPGLPLRPRSRGISVRPGGPRPAIPPREDPRPWLSGSPALSSPPSGVSPVGVGKEAFLVVRTRSVAADAAVAATAPALASSISSPLACAALSARTSSVSCFVTRAWEVPLLPARAVRPHRCRYSAPDRGKSNCTTWDTSRLSSPRAAMSVVTSTDALPDTKERKLSARALAGTAPW
mmetsp:Transcript_9389/g.31150  ORF Transcript_9389/g.31150 Transcript_9389/m.31150 type:complete len:243 (-) Transcript_9389:1029-1757(-)